MVHEEELDAMFIHAVRFLRSACRNAEEGPEQAQVAFDEARHAAEVFGKILYARKTGSLLGKQHAIGGILSKQGLIPAAFEPATVSRFFQEHTRGAYGYLEELDGSEVRAAIRIAEVFREAVAGWPNGAYHSAPRQADP